MRDGRFVPVVDTSRGNITDMVLGPEDDVWVGTAVWTGTELNGLFRIAPSITAPLPSADAFVVKSRMSRDLGEAIARTSAGETFVSPPGGGQPPSDSIRRRT